MASIEEIITTCFESEEMQDYLIEQSSELTQDKIAEIIIGAPIPLSRKAELIKGVEATATFGQIVFVKENNKDICRESAFHCLNIVVEHEIDADWLESIAVRPVLTPDGEIDDQALADYGDFITEVVLELEYAGLIVLDENDSNQSKTSIFFILADEEQYENNDMNPIIQLQVAAHVPSITEEQRKQINQKQKEEDYKVRVKWRVRNVSVNDKMFSTYEDALEYIIKIAVENKPALSI